MNLNTICLRIFLVLWMALFTVVAIYDLGRQAITPLAISWLATESVDAVVPNPTALVFYSGSGTQELVRTNLEYAGHAAILYTVLPIAPQSDRDREGYNHSIFRVDEEKNLAVVPVKYVRSFPSLVERELPAGNIWTHYRDTWRLTDLYRFMGFLLMIFGSAYWLYRDLKKSRARYRR